MGANLPRFQTVAAALTLALATGLSGCLKPSHGRNQPVHRGDPETSSEPGVDSVDELPPSNPPPVKFGLAVRPTDEGVQRDLLDVYCIECHAGANSAKGLDLTDVRIFLPPNDTHADPDGYHGRLVSPGRPSDSMLYLVMKSGRPDDQMPPPNSSIPAVTRAQLRAVEVWISSMDVPDDGATDEPGDEGGGDDEPGSD